MPKKTLVTYATRSGTTAEVAEAIAKTLSESGAPAEARPIKEVNDLSAYGAVVIGSAIRKGACMPEVVPFVRAHADVLKRVPVAYFVVCATMACQNDKYRSFVGDYLNPLRQIVQPKTVGLFAGAVRPERLPLLLRPSMAIMKMAMKLQGNEWRDWPAIKAWAATLPKALAL